MKPNPQPPQRVPVLTEVVTMPQAPAEVMEPYPEIVSENAQSAPLPAAPSEWPGPAEPPALAAFPEIDETLVAQRVLVDLERQLDLMFEHRLRETLAPLLTRMTDTLVREMRNQLASSMREMVSKAVSLELDRLQKR